MVNTKRKINIDHSQNNCGVLTQWAFVPLGPTLTYTTTNLNNFINFVSQ